MEQKKASIRRKETYPQALSGCNFQGPGFYIDEAFWDLKKSYHGFCRKPDSVIILDWKRIYGK
ncbi:hypothetical protein [Methanolobus sp. WCC5]|uniref:hypothetical protein n=1 Tax=Methanolobus sp. WCC5 TaxID=3125785 RepID=UPI003245D80B